MKGSRVVVGLLVLALIASACGQESGEPPATTTAGSSTTQAGGTTAATDPSSGIDDLDVPEANPVSVALTADNDRSVTADIGPDGGALEVTTTDGVVFTVSIPAGALVDTVAITATPVSGAGILDDAPHAAVRLEPVGLILYAPATITFINPLSADIPIGFGASAIGEDFHLRPLWGDAREIITHHFSTYGVTWGEQLRQVMDDGGFVPADIESLAQQMIATSESLGAGPYDGVALLARTVRARLNGSGTASELERGLIDILTVGSLTYHTFQISEEDPPAALVQIHRELVRMWFARVDPIARRAADACASDPMDAYFLFGWMLLSAGLIRVIESDPMVALGIGADQHEAEAELVEAWARLAQACLRFEATWDVAVDLVTGDDSSRVTTEARAVLDQWISDVPGPFGVQLPLRVRGEAESTVTSFSFEGCGGLGYTTEPGAVTISMQMLVTLDEPNRVQSALLDGYRVSIIPRTAPEVRCKPAVEGQTFLPNWGTLFYATPVSEVNRSRSSQAGWTFDLEPDSGTVTGSIAATIETDGATIEGTRGTVEQEIQLYHRPG